MLKSLNILSLVLWASGRVSNARGFYLRAIASPINSKKLRAIAHNCEWKPYDLPIVLVNIFGQSEHFSKFKKSKLFEIVEISQILVEPLLKYLKYLL